MHEVSLCESILRILEKQSKKDGFKKVVEVVLEVGALSGASPEALSFCFPLVSKKTIADRAKLTIKETDGTELRVLRLEVK